MDIYGNSDGTLVKVSRPRNHTYQLYLPRHVHSVALPSDIAELPQGLQAACPSSGLYIPEGQSTQTLYTAPVADPYVPAGHGIGCPVTPPVGVTPPSGQ